MRTVREILRLRFERGLSQRQTSASTGVSKGALSEYHGPNLADVPSLYRPVQCSLAAYILKWQLNM